MSKENGFVPLRRGLWEHLRDGRMSPFEALAFIYICSQADTRTGIWKGSAGALVIELGFNSRTARDLLERMERGGYIRRFCNPGVRHCYPILVHKFPITQGEHNGKVLDALSSTKQGGLLDLKYFPCEVRVEVDVEVHGKVHASQRRSENREERKTLSSASASTSASLESETRSAAFDVFWERWPRKEAKPAAVRSWTKIPVAEYPAIMAGLEKWILSNQWKRGVIPHPATWLNGKRWLDEDIPQFVGGSNGKVTSFSERRSQKSAAAINTVLDRFEKASGDIHRALPPANE
jgi:hypothetical protein